MTLTADLKAFAEEFVRTLPDALVRPELRVVEVDGRWFDEHEQVVAATFGVYVFVTSSGAIVYIGKADKTSIPARIWNHLKTPNKERNRYIERRGCVIYPNHRWTTRQSLVSEEIASGEFRVVCFILSSRSFASLLEVALQLWCEQHGGLPVFNLRVG